MTYLTVWLKISQPSITNNFLCFLSIIISLWSYNKEQLSKQAQSELRPGESVLWGGCSVFSKVTRNKNNLTWARISMPIIECILVHMV